MMIDGESTQACPPMAVHFSCVSQASAMAVLGKYILVYLGIFLLNICSDTLCQFVQSLFDSADVICLYDHSLRKCL